MGKERYFENGSAEAVVNVLETYQNADGDFGHRLEPDFWNINTTSIVTWFANEVLHEIAWTDKLHPIVQGILRYLDSGADFDVEHDQWLNVVPTNDEYAHAI